jgi:hypothetical protein
MFEDWQWRERGKLVRFSVAEGYGVNGFMV